MHQALLERWTTLLASARDGDGVEGPDPVPYGEDLLGRWAEPHRRYHTTAHLRAVLDRVDELAAQLSPASALSSEGQEPSAASTVRGPLPGPDLDAVRLAAWFHDAVYRPDRSENGGAAPRLAERALPEAGVPQARTAEVARLVRLTISHDPSPVTSTVNCSAMRTSPFWPAPRELRALRRRGPPGVAFVPDAAFREGRTTVLRQLRAARPLRTPTATLTGNPPPATT